MKKPLEKKMKARSRIRFIVCILLVLVKFSCLAQTDSVNYKRIKTVAIGGVAGYSLTLAGLNYLWYKDSEKQSFRFFNDNAEWKQLDKAGHFFSAYYLSYGASKTLRWSGLAKNKSDLIGAAAGFLMTVPIEIFDGFSSDYGASSGDLIADAAGATFFLGQQALWSEIRIHPKFSFHNTRYAALRPELLGDNRLSEIVKDYNGQTFWLSVDVDKFVAFPKWLNLAVGYGAEDMIFARDESNIANGFSPYRQYYLAIDFDLTSIKSRSKVVNTLLFIANMVKLPAPTLKFSPGSIRFDPFYF